jgi:hypothetical protein
MTWIAYNDIAIKKIVEETTKKCLKGENIKYHSMMLHVLIQCSLFLNILAKIDSTIIIFERVDMYSIDLKFEWLITVTKLTWKGIKVA